MSVHLGLIDHLWNAFLVPVAPLALLGVPLPRCVPHTLLITSPGDNGPTRIRRSACFDGAYRLSRRKRFDADRKRKRTEHVTSDAAGCLCGTEPEAV